MTDIDLPIRVFRNRSPTSAGNALVMALAVMGLLATIIVTTTDRGIMVHEAATSSIERDGCEAAAQLVLHRRTTLLQEALAGGDEGIIRRFDPAWNGDVPGRQNYGLDYVGGIPVRWAIEPMRTRQSVWVEGKPDGEDRQDAPDAAVGGNAIPWIQNPVPDPKSTQLPGEISNESLYLFRIRVDARSQKSNGRVRHAQGIRFVSASKEPLFRYVIFYAQPGPKGDIEFIHNDTFEARGNVHSNGSIYLGGDTVVANGAGWQSSVSVTKLGPGPEAVPQPARIEGYDGIFRLNKQSLFGAVNQFGFIPSPASPGNFYDVSTGPTVGESGVNPHFNAPTDGSSIYAATFNGTSINPNRVGADEASTKTFATVDTVNGDGNRIFNDGITGVTNCLRGADGAGGTLANDSRDRGRGVTRTWVTTSMAGPPTGFSRMARTGTTGALIKQVPETMRNNPFEFQALVPGPVSLPEFARPVFKFVDGSTTLDVPIATTPANRWVAEAPGTNIDNAFGRGNVMVRANFSGTTTDTTPEALATKGYNGWVIKKADGGVPDPPASMGFVVRERAVPFMQYQPSASTSIDALSATPYCYGKHNRTSSWPWVGIDITPNAGTREDCWDANTGMPYPAFEPKASATEAVGTQAFDLGWEYDGRQWFQKSNWGGIAKRKQSQSYAVGGVLSATTLNAKAPPRFQRAAYGYYDRPVGEAGMADPQWYRSTGRFFHAQRMTPDESRQGLLATVYDDWQSLPPPPLGGGQSNRVQWRASKWYGPLSGQPIITMLTSGSAWASDAASPLKWGASPMRTSAVFGADGLGYDLWSVRLVGFIKPSGPAVRFRVDGDDGFRVWMSADGPDHDQLLIDDWRTRGMGDPRISDIVPCSPENWAPFSIEYFQRLGGRGFDLQWSFDNGVTWSYVPVTRLCPPAGNSTGAFARGDWSSTGWKSTTVRLASSMMPNPTADEHKVGLMIRPLPPRTIAGAANVNSAGGIPFLADGRDPYFLAAFSPNRGVFTEFRGEKAVTQWRGRSRWFVGRSLADDSATRLSDDYGCVELPLPTTATPLANVELSPRNRNRAGLIVPKLVYPSTAQLVRSGYDASKAITPTISATNTWKLVQTPDGHQGSLVQGALQFSVQVAAKEDYRNVRFSRWGFSLASGLTRNEIFRWQETSGIPDTGRDLAVPRFIRAYQTNVMGTPKLLQWGWDNNTTSAFSQPDAEADQVMQLWRVDGAGIGYLGGAINWQDVVGTPRVINYDGQTPVRAWHGYANSTDLNIGEGRWFVAQWTDSGAVSTLSLLKPKADQPPIPTKISGLGVVDVYANGAAVVAGSSPTGHSLDLHDVTDTADPATGTGPLSSRTIKGSAGGGQIYWYIDADGWRPKFDGAILLTWDDFKVKFAPYLTDPSVQIVHLYGVDPLKLSMSAAVLDIADTTVVAPAPAVVYDWAMANRQRLVSGGDNAGAAAWDYGGSETTLARTFALDRSDYAVFDLNSRISGAETWYDPPVSQVFPWSPKLWSFLTQDVPVTGAYPPHMNDGTKLVRRGVEGVTDPTSVLGAVFFKYTNPASANGLSPIGQNDYKSSPLGLPEPMYGWKDDIWNSDFGSRPAMPAHIWFRVEKVGASSIQAYYAIGEDQPKTWNAIGLPKAMPAAWQDLLIGPMLAGEDPANATSMVADHFQVEFYDQQTTGLAARADPKNILDSMDQDAGAVVPDADARYLASQYQVFFGPWDVTEDAFTYRSPSGRPMMSETWIYNLREFWSQSRWWDDGHEKEGGNDPLPTAPATQLMNRERLARVTLLDLDMEAFQHWLQDRTLAGATADRIEKDSFGVAIGAPPLDTGALAGNKLNTLFNGLVWLGRTNRYPSNPDPVGPNPWNPMLPNSNAGIANLFTNFNAQFTNWIAVQQRFLGTSGTNAALCKSLLQPFTALDRAPAFRPTQWHHGVRLVRGDSIFWNFPLVGGAMVTDAPFGTSKMTIMSPNPLYVQGDFNSVGQSAKKNGIVSPKEKVPAGIYADDITVLSNAWSDDPMRRPGFYAEPGTKAIPSAAMKQAGCSLARGVTAQGGDFLSLPTATTTTIVAALVTNNLPTTKESVAIGESATVVDTIRFLENWNGADFNYTGSLVVLDSKRSTEAMLLGYAKAIGPSPFGFLDGWTTPTWTHTTRVNTIKAWWNAFGNVNMADGANLWPNLGQNRVLPGVYSNPAHRNFAFNADLLTLAGTPPFAPFGVSTGGAGGWLRSW